MVADERAVRRRSSHPRRPRVMRRHPRGCRRSVDRGTGELGIEPRNVEAPGRRRCREKRKATRRAPSWRGARRPCAVRDPMRVRKPSAREPGDLWPARRPRLRAAAGRLRPHAVELCSASTFLSGADSQDGRWWPVRLAVQVVMSSLLLMRLSASASCRMASRLLVEVVGGLLVLVRRSAAARRR
jgi:hypothetical protein